MATLPVAAGASAGIGLDALPPVRKSIGSGFWADKTLRAGDINAFLDIAPQRPAAALLMLSPAALQAENPAYKDIVLTEDSAFEVWGVIAKSIRML